MSRERQAQEAPSASAARAPRREPPARAGLDALHGRLGNQGLSRLLRKAAVSAPGDPSEREADEVAEQVMRMAVPSPIRPGPALVQRQCSTCEEIERKDLPTLRRKCTSCEEEEQQLSLQREGDAPDAPEVGAADAAVQFAERGGEPLPAPVRSFFEPRFGQDFSQVRIHTGGQAAEVARSVDARAYTVGSSIVFGAGEYAPHTEGGQRLLAHELTHVVQQSGGVGRKVAPLIQRTTHSGTTPTNCHNWKIPLPPWIAGTIAHGQIGAMLGIPPAAVPRATKLLMGVPSPPAITPFGYVDLFQRNPASVGIAEIKSTQTGDATARAEAAHYVVRHTEWLTRAPWAGDATDLSYAGRVGGPFPGGILDLSPRTGTDLNLGAFWGDPLKQLHIEADPLGSVVYWCTGAGLPGSPVWYPAFRRLVNEIKDLLNQAKRALQGALEGIATAAASAWAAIRGWIGDIVDWGMAHSRVLAFLLLLVILIVAIVALILSILAEPPSAGTSTVGVVASVAAMAGACAGMLVLLGISAPSLPSASTTVAMSMMPEQADAAASGADYERSTGAGSYPTSQAAAAATRVDPAGDFLAALAPVRDPVALFQSVSGSVRAIPPGGVRQLSNGIDLLERNGDAATASFLRGQMAANGLA